MHDVVPKNYTMPWRGCEIEISTAWHQLSLVLSHYPLHKSYFHGCEVCWLMKLVYMKLFAFFFCLFSFFYYSLNVTLCFKFGLLFNNSSWLSCCVAHVLQACWVSFSHFVWDILFHFQFLIVFTFKICVFFPF
jgi:hypothetical protein